MQKQLRIVNVSYSPGTPTVSIDVQPELLDDDGSVIPLGLRETVTTRQDDLKQTRGNWGDADVARAVAEATVTIAEAVEAAPAVKDGDTGAILTPAVKAKAAVTALRFDGLTIVP